MTKYKHYNTFNSKGYRMDEKVSTVAVPQQENKEGQKAPPVQGTPKAPEQATPTKGA